MLEQPLSWDWIVGFWEGDGNISRGTGVPVIRFTQKDVTILERIKNILCEGSIYTDKRGYSCLNVSSRDHLIRLAHSVKTDKRVGQLSEYKN